MERLIRLEFRAARSSEPWLPCWGPGFQTVALAQAHARRWTAVGCLEYRVRPPAVEPNGSLPDA